MGRLKKIVLGTIFVISIAGVAYIPIAVLFFFPNKIGYQLIFKKYEERKILDYENPAPKFSFKYYEDFVIDKDEENKYGEDYLVGFKLRSDARTGCDVRVQKMRLDLTNFSATADSLAKFISRDAKGFKLHETKEVQINKNAAILLDFEFLGPIQDTLRVQQVFLPKREATYFLICGANKDVFKFFQEDFGLFFTTFSFN